ncbi:RluA family pseudouridine synthase [Chelatococcus reniformis]|uniref:Ribosomal large subunit pseudouridine synthase D n=1 Tax=Chelatococcus reniformis TaxID=1494448 RepID=A0A916XAS3_9HYPH|nr:RluA family pseudouridine synthase [Chelatococcus reniformis]GGC57888.1 pseudouridine synthase [Chelatococcus reniformis]
MTRAGGRSGARPPRASGPGAASKAAGGRARAGGPAKSKPAAGAAGRGKRPGAAETSPPRRAAGVGRRQDERGTAGAGSVPPRGPAQPRAAAKAQTAETLASGVQTLAVGPDEAGMRLDRFLVARFPQLAFTHIQRIVRKGELRVDGGRVKPNDRLEAGQQVRVPPLKLASARPSSRTPAQDEGDAAFIKSLVLYEDRDIMVLNKPMGLAVQGGSGTRRHVDGMLEALRDKEGQKPRLVHRLDKDTAGCLVIAKTRLAAATLAKSFRSRAARKIYWALVAGVPRVKQGRVSTYVAKEEGEEGDSRMGVARHGDEGASHAVTYYALVENSAQKLAWLSLKPVTGRTHQLRVHAAHIGHPIVGDPKYFDIENWELPGGIQKKLHLLARRIVIPHPRTGTPVDVTAPLPPHMAQTWNLLGFDASRYDPIVDSPDE